MQLKKIESACKDNNIKVGIHCLSPSYLKDKLSNGYDLATLGSDVRIYAEGISNKMKEARS
jgi:2-keto-3-deoxy-L-rhamnonate aldolase RhmA